jgi:hypothetical protein
MNAPRANPLNHSRARHADHSGRDEGAVQGFVVEPAGEVTDPSEGREKAGKNGTSRLCLNPRSRLKRVLIWKIWLIITLAFCLAAAIIYLARFRLKNGVVPAAATEGWAIENFFAVASIVRLRLRGAGLLVLCVVTPTKVRTLRGAMTSQKTTGQETALPAG